MEKKRNRKLVWRRVVVGMLVAAWFLACCPEKAYGASGSISLGVSAASVTTGQTVTVSVQLSADTPIGYSVEISYPAAILEYQGGADSGGGGRITVLSEGDGSSTAFSRSITFRAVGNGTASISASGSFVDFNSFESFAPAAGGTSVTVRAPGGGSSDSGSGSNANANTGNNPNSDNDQEALEGSGDNTLKSLEISPGSLKPAFSADTYAYTVDVAEDTKSIVVSAITNDAKAKVSVTHSDDLEPGANKTFIVVTAENGTQKTYVLNVNCGEVKEDAGISVMGKDYNFATEQQLAEVTIPEGFTKAELEYQGNSVISYQTEGQKLTLVYLVDGEEKGAWFLYRKEQEEFMPYIELASGGNRYVILVPNESVKAPDGYQVCEFQIDEKTVYGFVRPEAPDFNLVYATHFNGDPGLYFYDGKENTLQRYHAEERIVEQIKEKPQVIVEEPLVTESEMTRNLRRIVYMLGGILVLMLAGWMVSLMLMRQKIYKQVVDEQQKALDADNAECAEDIE